MRQVDLVRLSQADESLCGTNKLGLAANFKDLCIDSCEGHFSALALRALSKRGNFGVSGEITQVHLLYMQKGDVAIFGALRGCCDALKTVVRLSN